MVFLDPYMLSCLTWSAESVARGLKCSKLTPCSRSADPITPSCVPLLFLCAPSPPAPPLCAVPFTGRIFPEPNLLKNPLGSTFDEGVVLGPPPPFPRLSAPRPCACPGATIPPGKAFSFEALVFWLEPRGRLFPEGVLFRAAILTGASEPAARR